MRDGLAGRRVHWQRPRPRLRSSLNVRPSPMVIRKRRPVLRKRPAPSSRPTVGESRHPRMSAVTQAEAAAIERLRRICMALPAVTEKLAWGEPTWRAGKIFAQVDTHHHGADHVAVWLPARPGV